MALAIAHCGDGNNNNDNTTPGTRTVTPTPAGATRTPTPVVSTSTSGSPESPTVTATPTGGCPSAISFESDATTSRLDAGWTGNGQNSKIIDKGKVTTSVSGCANSSPPCGVCNLSGPIANPDAGAGTSNNRRCTNDTSIECTSDSACTGGTCKFFFGAPLPLTAGAVSTCVVNEVTGTISGTANIESGESEATVSLVSHVVQASDNSAPCPKCLNDPTPEDGNRGGTCSAGPREGQTCDVGGTSPTFGPTSFDCPPPSNVIGNLPITLPTSTSTRTRTLSADSPNCTGAAGKKCFCSVCGTTAATPCFSNADCPAGITCGGKLCFGGPTPGAPCATKTDCGAGALFCSQPPNGAASKPNDCTDTVCSPVAGQPNNGECLGGPPDQFCDPTETFKGCSSNAECTAPGDTCVGRNRPCFLDNGAIGGSVSAVGEADPPVGGVAHPALGALFCVPQTSAGAVNAAAGLPGLGRLQLRGTATQID
jgi:hypothetical protein